jgi:hypothetical protein
LSRPPTKHRQLPEIEPGLFQPFPQRLPLKVHRREDKAGRAVNAELSEPAPLAPWVAG